MLIELSISVEYNYPGGLHTLSRDCGAVYIGTVDPDGKDRDPYTNVTISALRSGGASARDTVT